ncbi:hypothetical protein AB0D67_06355 [Streptosporangium sp. NPDC048047]|uniref:hypothetical protein n=1 Tax=Streptosporangium sp. NPDC048047 TaxID=3155748 RepID=UPI00341AE593
MDVSDLSEGSGRLVELAWELNDLGFDSVVRLPPGRRPSMEVFLPPGRPRPVTAQHGRTVTFTWPGVPGRRTHSRPDHDRPAHDHPDRDRSDHVQPDHGQLDHDQLDELLPGPPRRSRMRELAERLAEVVR